MWGVVYRRYLDMVREGKSVVNGTIPRRMAGTLKDEFCRLSPFGKAVGSVQRQKVEQCKQRLLAGTQAIYQGPLRDNKGRIAIPSGRTIAIEDPALDRMNWLLDGIQGEIPN